MHNVKDIGLITECACITENNIWYFEYDINALIRYDISLKKGEFVGFVPWEEITGKRLYREIYYYKDKLILIPYMAKNIAIYYIKDGTFVKNCSKINAAATCIKDENIYLLPRDNMYGNGLFRYNIDSDILEKIIDFSEIAVKRNLNRVWASNMTIRDNTIAFCFGHTDLFILYSIDNGKIYEGRIPGGINRCYGLTYLGNNLLAVDFDYPRGVVFSFDGKYMDDIKLNLRYSSEIEKYYDLISIEDRVILNYEYREDIFELYSSAGKVRVKNIPGEAKYYGRVLSAFEDYLVLPTSNRKSFIYKGKEMCIGSISLPDEFKQVLLKSSCVIETEEFDISDLITSLK